MRAGGWGASLDVRVARTAEDLAAHHAVRRAVFVEEQGIFEEDDGDAWDDGAVKVVAVAGGRVVGAVRLYPLDEAGLWKGDRLAVLRDARRLHVGAPLVRFAVRTAGERGGTRMVARIQARPGNRRRIAQSSAPVSTGAEPSAITVPTATPFAAVPAKNAGW